MCACVCECEGLALTQHGDVDAGRGLLVLDALVDMAEVVSTLGHSGMREDQAGAHAHGGEEVRQRLHIGDLEGEGGFEIFTIWVENGQDSDEGLISGQSED